MHYRTSCLALAMLLCVSGASVKAQDLTPTTITDEQKPPPSPTGLHILQKPDPDNKKLHRILLEWDNSPNAIIESYRIFRFENPNTESLTNIAEVTHYAPPRNQPHPKIQYMDVTALPGHTYTYFLVSKDKFGHQSENSSMSTAMAPNLQ